MFLFTNIVTSLTIHPTPFLFFIVFYFKLLQRSPDLCVCTCSGVFVFECSRVLFPSSPRHHTPNASSSTVFTASMVLSSAYRRYLFRLFLFSSVILSFAKHRTSYITFGVQLTRHSLNLASYTSALPICECHLFLYYEPQLLTYHANITPSMAISSTHHLFFTLFLFHLSSLSSPHIKLMAFNLIQPRSLNYASCPPLPIYISVILSYTIKSSFSYTLHTTPPQASLSPLYIFFFFTCFLSHR